MTFRGSPSHSHILSYRSHELDLSTENKTIKPEQMIMEPKKKGGLENNIPFLIGWFLGSMLIFRGGRLINDSNNLQKIGACQQ